MTLLPEKGRVLLCFSSEPALIPVDFLVSTVLTDVTVGGLVGKTLTTEAIAEDLQLLFYSVRTRSSSRSKETSSHFRISRELRSDAKSLEHQLGDIFDTAAAWSTILLLEEAEVYFSPPTCSKNSATPFLIAST